MELSVSILSEKDNYISAIKKIDKYINCKYWGSLSSLDKYLLNVVKNCNTYIEEANPSEETSNIQKLTQIVACQMTEYKNNYLNINITFIWRLTNILYHK